MNQDNIKVTNLHKHIDNKQTTINILNGLNLNVAAHESIAILGKSGSGKSTLLNILAGLDLPQQGQVEIFGQDITKLNEDQRAHFRANKTGFVFQSFYLMEDLTAQENIALPLELFGHKNPDSTAAQWLEKLGLSNRAQHFPQQLSGGEQQRVSLARAFALKPAVLFADEPTANLDSLTAKKVLDQMFELQQTPDCSMLIATHDQELANRCDHTIRLENGKLVAGGLR